MRAAPLSLASLLVLSSVGFCATTAVNSTWTDNFNPAFENPIADSFGAALPGGAVLQIGYFDPAVLASTSVPSTLTEWASFVAISGSSSKNPHIDTRIGDGVGGLDGFYDLGVTFDTATDTDLPGSSARVGVRYFDPNGTPGNRWNTVTSAHPAWVMAAPANQPPPPAGAILDARVDSSPGDPSPGLVWEDNANPFQTTVPEPSASLLGLLGAFLLLRRRR